MRRLKPRDYDRHPLQPHPIAETLPELDEATFRELLESIYTAGVVCPIVLYEGKILDGRARYAVCRRLGKPCPYEVFEGSEEAAKQHYFSLNCVRRDLTEPQIAIVENRLT